MKLDKYVVRFGKYKGKSLEEIPLKELDGYLSWLEEKAGGHLADELKNTLKEYLKQNETELEREML